MSQTIIEYLDNVIKPALTEQACKKGLSQAEMLREKEYVINGVSISVEGIGRGQQIRKIISSMELSAFSELKVLENCTAVSSSLCNKELVSSLESINAIMNLKSVSDCINKPKDCECHFRVTCNETVQFTKVAGVFDSSNNCIEAEVAGICDDSNHCIEASS
jgi:hypothetical protein